MGHGWMEGKSRAYEHQIDRQNEREQAERLLASGELGVEHPRRSVELALPNQGSKRVDTRKMTPCE